MKDKKHKTIMMPARTGKTFLFCLPGFLDDNTISDGARNVINEHCTSQKNVKPVMASKPNETDQ